MGLFEENFFFYVNISSVCTCVYLILQNNGYSDHLAFSSKSPS